MTARIGIVVIGRNEGARLRACLSSLAGIEARIVYVDSGSTDASAEVAIAAGAEVVHLTEDRPFTAARGRNAGFAALMVEGSAPEFVQFIDGDCRLVEGWIAAATAALQGHPDWAVVTGWRSEIHRDRSVYNQLCDVEWHRPAGQIAACGGDMMVRAAAFDAVGGMNEAVIAAEDDEFCVRLGKAGWKLWRLPVNMTRHDADMTRLSEWWRRAVRSGHGFAQVGWLHPDYFRSERRRVMLYGALIPALALVMGAVHPAIGLGVLAAYPLSYLRTVRGLRAGHLPRQEALRHAVLLTLSKWPNLIGMATFYFRNFRQADMKIIEYK